MDSGVSRQAGSSDVRGGVLLPFPLRSAHWRRWTFLAAAACAVIVVALYWSGPLAELRAEPHE